MNSSEFDKAEEFCFNKSSGDQKKELITILLTIYFEYYEANMAESRAHKTEGKIEKSL